MNAIKLGLVGRLLGVFLILGNAMSSAIWADDQDEQPLAYHYQGTMQVEPEVGQIALEWRIEVFDTTLQDITFALRDSLKDIRVTGPWVATQGVRPLQEGSGMQALKLTLKPGEGYRYIDVSYHGVLLPDPMPNGINHIGADYIELNVDSFWHPIDMRFNQYLTSEVQVTLPQNWRGVTGGMILRQGDDLIIRNDIPSLDISFTLSPHFKETQLPDFAIYDLREKSEDTDKMITAARQCYDYLQPRYGQKLTLPEGRFVLHDRAESGYSRYNYIALSSIAGRDQSHVTGFLCHELTHFWSRHGNFGSVENWLNESFAVYTELMAIRHYFGTEVFQQRLDRLEERIAAKPELPNIYDGENMARRPYLINYGKGPIALHALEQRIGADAFQQFMMSYMAGAVKTTPELLEILEAQTDLDTRQWFADALAK